MGYILGHELSIPFLMIIGGIGAALSMIYVPLGRLVLYLTLPFLIYFEKIVSFISGLRLNFTVSEFNEFFAAGYYLLLLALVIVLLRYKKT